MRPRPPARRAARRRAAGAGAATSARRVHPLAAGGELVQRPPAPAVDAVALELGPARSRPPRAPRRGPGRTSPRCRKRRPTKANSAVRTHTGRPDVRDDQPGLLGELAARGLGRPTRPASAPPPGVNHQLPAAGSAGSRPCSSRTRSPPSTSRTRAPTRSSTSAARSCPAAYVGGQLHHSNGSSTGSPASSGREQLGQPTGEEPFGASRRSPRPPTIGGRRSPRAPRGCGRPSPGAGCVGVDAGQHHVLVLEHPAAAAHGRWRCGSTSAARTPPAGARSPVSSASSRAAVAATDSPGSMPPPGSSHQVPTSGAGGSTVRNSSTPTGPVDQHHPHRRPLDVGDQVGPGLRSARCARPRPRGARRSRAASAGAGTSGAPRPAAPHRRGRARAGCRVASAADFCQPGLVERRRVGQPGPVRHRPDHHERAADHLVLRDVPPPGSPRCARESDDIARWSPMTHSRPGRDRDVERLLGRLVARVQVVGLVERDAVDRDPALGVAAGDVVAGDADDALDEVLLRRRREADEAGEPGQRPSRPGWSAASMVTSGVHESSPSKTTTSPRLMSRRW